MEWSLAMWNRWEQNTVQPPIYVTEHKGDYFKMMKEKAAEKQQYNYMFKTFMKYSTLGE